MKLKQFSSFFLILLTAALGAGVSVLAKIGLRETPPLNFTFWRFISALIILLPIFYIQKKRLAFGAFIKLFWVLLFGAGNILIFIFGIRLTTASASQVIYTFSPLFAGVLSYFILNDKLGLRKIVGVVLGFLGTLLIILLPVLTGNSKIDGTIAGNLLILLAVTSHSLYTVLSKRKQKEFSPIELTVYLAFFVLASSLILMPADGATLSIPSTNSFFSIIYSGIAGTALFYLLYQYAIKISSALIASMVLYLEPIFTFIWAALLIGERITIWLIVGMIIVLTGVFIASTARKEKIIEKKI